MGVDKYAFHILGNALFQGRFPSPPTMIISNTTKKIEIQEFVHINNYPAELVLKPLDSSEGKGVVFLKREELDRYLNALQQLRLPTLDNLKETCLSIDQNKYVKFEQLYNELHSQLIKENSILLQVKVSPTPEGTIRSYSIDGKGVETAYIHVIMINLDFHMLHEV